MVLKNKRYQRAHKRTTSRKLNPYRNKSIIGKIKGFFHYLFLTKPGLRKVGLAFLILMGLMVILFGYYAKDLPSPGKINSRLTAQSTQIFDRNGKLLYEIHGNENRILADWKDIPQDVKDATVAIEDRGFYKHFGFDTRRIIGSAIYDITHGNKAQGASTITQQYVKNALLTNEKSFTRKIKEIMLALMMEQMYSKDDILKMYLNEIPYGSNAYGIQTASKTYFNKAAKDLTLEEAAVLAALPQAPTYYSPFGLHKEELLNRKNLVLDQMASQGYITKDEAKTAKAAALNFSTNQYGSITAPHFVMYVKEKLIEKYTEKTVNEGGLKVFTTLDMEKQKMAEEAVATNVDKNSKLYKASNASLVAIDPKTGQILAMVGSRNFFDENIDGNVNVSIMDRQPGSSFKPFVYATAFKSDGWGPGSTVFDLKTDFGGGYIPNNYNGTFKGPVSVRTALQGSLNIPAVKMLYLAGTKDVLDTAHNMGITTLNDPEKYGLSLVLGAGEVKLLDMVGAYGVFANNGIKKENTWFTKIQDSKGKILEEYKETAGKKVMDPQVTYLVNNVLSDDPSRAFVFGAGSALTLPGRPVAAKTGTTDSYKDAWTMGYTPSLVAGVWSGNNDGTPMSKSGGSIAAAPIWHDFMVRALAGTPAEQFSKPSGIKSVTLDAITGKKPTASSKQTRTDIFPSWYKIKDALGGEYRINKITGKLVNDTCPPQLIETVSRAEVTAEIPKTDSAYARWFAPIEAWAKANGYVTGALDLQTDTCDFVKEMPTISITSPLDGDNVIANPLKIKMNIEAPKGVESATVTIDDKSYVASPDPNGNGYVVEVILVPGSHTITASVTDKLGQTAQAKSIKIKVVLATTTTIGITTTKKP